MNFKLMKKKNLNTFRKERGRIIISVVHIYLFETGDSALEGPS